MARKYTVTTGLSSLAASTTKVAAQVASPATETAVIIGADITFDGVAGAAAGGIPVRAALVRETGASTGGAAQTPQPWRKGDLAANCTARINDTTDGAGPAIIMEWLVSPNAGQLYQFPLGREIPMPISDFLALRLTSQAGMTTCNYIANLHIEEGGSG